MWKSAHFIGIGGVGMSAAAKLLRDTGAKVTGSDEEVYSPVLDLLKREGITWKTPYAAENIPTDAELIVIGKNAKLVPETNAEVAAALISGKKVMSFPEVLAEMSAQKETVVVAGSYGKSSSTALLSHVLEYAGVGPSYFIGAVPLSPATPSKLGTGNLFIMEGDEYPASNTDPRSKFLLMNPRHVLLTPLAHDHFNVFPTPADYLQPFVELLKITKGTVVACAEGALSKILFAEAERPFVTYGVAEGEYRAANIQWNEKTSFDIERNGETVVQVQTTQLGAHSIQNIVGVAAMVFSLHLLTPEQFAAGIASFRGIVRRLDRKSEKTTLPIYEGFGSSYEKARSALAAMKQHFPSRRLVVVFEPNTIGWRSRAALTQYDTVFEDAAEVFIFAPPHDGKETELTPAEIAARVSEKGVPARAFSSAEDLSAALAEKMSSNDCILLSSSGAMGGLTESIPRLAEERFPN